jgi:hypothetical protein
MPHNIKVKCQSRNNAIFSRKQVSVPEKNAQEYLPRWRSRKSVTQKTRSLKSVNFRRTPAEPGASGIGPCACVSWVTTSCISLVPCCYTLCLQEAAANTSLGASEPRIPSRNYSRPCSEACPRLGMLWERGERILLASRWPRHDRTLRRRRSN